MAGVPVAPLRGCGQVGFGSFPRARASPPLPQRHALPPVREAAVRAGSGGRLAPVTRGETERRAAGAQEEGRRQILEEMKVLCEQTLPDMTALHLACANGHPAVVALLLETKCLLNLCDDENRTALMKAVECQEEDCATLLLEHGADPNVTDACGNAALHHAVLCQNTSLAAKLLSYNAHIEARNKDGLTPVLLAVRERRGEMVEFLIDKEASVRAVDKMKRTALMLAIKHESPEIVRLLLQQGVDILSEDVCGWTAEEYAAVSSFNIFRQLISEYKEKRPKTSPEKSNPADESSEEDCSRRFPNEPGVDLGPPSNNEVLDFKTKHVVKPKLTKLMKTSQQSNRNIEAKCGILRPESTTFSEDNNSDSNIEDMVETFPKPSPWFEGICQPAFPSPEPVPKLLKSVAGLGPTKVKEQIDYVNDLDDLTQSSETVSEDGDVLYSTNSTLQVEPLDVGCKDSGRKLKIRDATLSHETLIDFQRSHCELLRGAPHKLKSKGCGLQKEVSESEEVKSQLEHQKAEWERELGSLRFTLKKEEKNRRNANMSNEKIREQLRKEDKYSKEVETTTRTHSPSTQNGTADYEK